MTRAGLAAGLALLLAAPGCTRTTELLAPSAECAATGPVVHLGGTDDASCAGALASRFGRYALCTCDALNVMGAFTVAGLNGPAGGAGGSGGSGGGFGVDAGAPPASQPAGAVGVDSYVLIWGPTMINGPLIASASGGIKIAGGSLGGNVHSGGVMGTLANVRAERDVFVVGDINGPYIVGGTLHLGAGASAGPDVRVTSVLREPVSVDPPCPCDAPFFDIAAAVSDRKTRNANPSLPFAAAFAGEIALAQTFDWPCGEFYLPGLRTAAGAPLELRIHGRAGIFVDGDVRLGDNLSVTLDPGAELDLVVAGSFYTNGRLFGAPEAPARLRLWVASKTVSLPAQIQFGAMVYAPSAVLSAGVGLTVDGSLFVHTLQVDSDIQLLYDPAAALGGASCGVSPPATID